MTTVSNSPEYPTGFSRIEKTAFVQQEFSDLIYNRPQISVAEFEERWALIEAHIQDIWEGQPGGRSEQCMEKYWDIAEAAGGRCLIEKMLENAGADHPGIFYVERVEDTVLAALWFRPHDGKDELIVSPVPAKELYTLVRIMVALMAYHNPRVTPRGTVYTSSVDPALQSTVENLERAISDLYQRRWPKDHVETALKRFRRQLEGSGRRYPVRAEQIAMEMETWAHDEGDE